MRLAKNQVLICKQLIPEMESAISNELNILLQFILANNDKRPDIYEKWNMCSLVMPGAKKKDTTTLSSLLLKIVNQGKVFELFTTLERLVHIGIKPNVEEFLDVVQNLLHRPRIFSNSEFSIIRTLQEYPTATTSKISNLTGLHRQTVASNIRKLSSTMQITCRPIINFQALGLRKIQVWFRGNIGTTQSPYFLSRFSLVGTEHNKGWLIDTWTVPIGYETKLLESYLKLNQNKLITEFYLKEILSFGQHLLLPSNQEENTYLTCSDMIKFILRRLVKGQTLFIPKFLEWMVYSSTQTKMIDSLDIAIIDSLYNSNYLFQNTKQELAKQLGISRSTLSRRLKLLEEDNIIRPSIQLEEKDLVPTILLLPIEHSHYLNALMCLPSIQFCLLESQREKKKDWFVLVKSDLATTHTLTKLFNHNNINIPIFPTHIMDQRRENMFFSAFNKQNTIWDFEKIKI